MHRPYHEQKQPDFKKRDIDEPVKEREAADEVEEIGENIIENVEEDEEKVEEG